MSGRRRIKPQVISIDGLAAAAQRRAGSAYGSDADAPRSAKSLHRRISDVGVIRFE
jgi:hypothetical protein